MPAARAPSFRIIGGRWRGRRVRFAPTPALRISGDRARESLFNILGQKLDGRACLDLFAGAGALGLEAASRGAESVLCVERNFASARALRRTAAALGADSLRVVHCRAEDFLAECESSFDLILMDPPFADYAADKTWRRLLQLAARALSANGAAYCESDRHFSPPDGWKVVRRKKTGAAHWQILQQ